MSGSYRDLQAWQKAIELVGEIYSCTAAFPKDRDLRAERAIKAGGCINTEQHRRG